jgi:hypothetical protein
MLNCNVHFKWTNINYTNWTMMSMLQKLTDEHAVNSQIKKMKVKHAAQIFSHRVQSTMRGLIKYGKFNLHV